MSIKEEAEKISKKLEELEQVEVRIAVFGRTGTGKSSLIKCLMGKDLSSKKQSKDRPKVGPETNTTLEPKEYEWKGIHLVDLPGYDTKDFPKENFVQKFKIMDFDIILCLFD